MPKVHIQIKDVFNILHYITLHYKKNYIKHLKEWNGMKGKLSPSPPPNTTILLPMSYALDELVNTMQVLPHFRTSIYISEDKSKHTCLYTI